MKNAAEYEIGAEIKADIFAAGDKVDVSGVSKGKGYAEHNQEIQCTERTYGPRFQITQSNRFYGFISYSQQC